MKIKLLIILLILLIPSFAIAGLNPKTASWTAPTTNTDGTAITNGAGFNLYCGKTSNTYTVTINIPNWSTTSTSLPIFSNYVGQIYCSMTAYNTAGGMSGYSNEVSYQVDTLAPSSPGNFN